MYWKKKIDQPLTLINSPMLLGSMSEPEQIIAGGIQTLENQEYFYTEYCINSDKDSPRIDFLVQFSNNQQCAIEVNGYQHFSFAFNKTSEEYRNQWYRYFSKVNWCRERNIPMIHINILLDSRTCSKQFRKCLYDIISSNIFQDAINAALSGKKHVAINITKSGVLMFDQIKYKSGISDYVATKFVSDIILGQGSNYKSTKTLNVL